MAEAEPAKETKKAADKKPAAKKEPEKATEPEAVKEQVTKKEPEAETKPEADKKAEPAKKPPAKKDKEPAKNKKEEKSETKPEPAKDTKNTNIKENKGPGKNNDKKDLETGEKSVDDLTELWMEFQKTVKFYNDRGSRLENALVKVESRVNSLGKFCGDYQLIWRLKSFDKCFQEAKSGERKIIYSPQFDTHRNGYKLQLSLCPYGDGKGKGNSMSIFFAILKGPYDTLLQWPFTCPVTISLIEQVADAAVRQPRDATMTFTPNPNPSNAPFLSRPVKDRNMSLGFSKFITLNELFDGEYIKDDSAFIKVCVDLTSIISL